MPNPIRILQIIGLLDRGGVEVWLMNVLRNIDRSEFQIDFLVHVDYPCAFDDEARQLGTRILRLRQPKHIPLSYRRQLSALLRDHGPYDIFHSHVHLRSGFNLQTAASCGVPVQIAHSHADSRRWYEHASLGTHANVLAYHRVGRGSKISANSVVTQNVQPHSLAYGVPGRHSALIHNQI